MSRALPKSKFRAPATAERPFALPLSEDDIQRAVFDHLRRRGVPGHIALHLKNGGVHQATKGQRINNAKMGVKSGASDVYVLYAGKSYFLELKAEGKRVEPGSDQDKFLQRVWDQGGVAGWAAGLDNALKHLEAWGLLRGEAV